MARWVAQIVQARVLLVVEKQVVRVLLVVEKQVVRVLQAPPVRQEVHLRMRLAWDHWTPLLLVIPDRRLLHLRIRPALNQRLPPSDLQRLQPLSSSNLPFL